MNLVKDALIVLAIGLSACSSQKMTSDAKVQTQTAGGLCFYGGSIYTAIDASPKLSAVAVRGNVIAATSTERPAAKWCEEHAGQSARMVDLAGGALYPGFTDGHGHLMEIGIKEMSLKLTDIRSVSQLQARLKTAVKTTPKGEPIFSRGWIETHWPERRFPNRQDLDAVSPEHPVVLERADGHAVVVNSRMLSLAGITRDTADPFGGEILRDENGDPTGVLIDKAAWLVLDYHPKLTPERKRAAYIKGAQLYASRGWTNIHAMSVDPADLELIQDLVSENAIKLRVYNSVLSPEGKIMPGSKSEATNLSEHLTTRAIKLYADGALGSRGAALFEDYSDDAGNEGLMRMEREASLKIFRDALRTGTQVTAHAIGDRANREILNWMAQAFDDVPVPERAVSDPRWRIEHSQIVSADDIPRFSELGIIPSMQPSHAIGDLHFAVDRLGSERSKGGYAWRTFIDDGSIIIGGTDAPVEVGDPLIEFYAAITREDLEGYSGTGWYPELKVTRQEALKMFTAWPAYGAFQEHGLGTIEAGKRADFTMFDRDIMEVSTTEILGARTIMTVVDGEIIFEAE